MDLESQIARLVNNLKHDIPKVGEIVVDKLSEEITKTAQRNFDQDPNDVGADDPVVNVTRSYAGNQAEVVCSGDQVLFIEFGAGAQNSFRNAKDYNRLGAKHEWEGFIEQTTIKVQGRIIPARGFADYGTKEIAPRPNGIVPLGEFGQKRGKNDYWVRPSRTMEKKNREGYVHTKNGGIRNGALWTCGTPPKRALWRARSSALSKLLSGRLKLK